MTTETALIKAPELPAFAVTLEPEALRIRELALESAALVGRVSNADENAKAVEAQAELKRVSSMLEKARVAITKPLLEAQRTIKATVDKERKELELELSRVSRLIGDFQALELKRIRAEEAAKKAEMDRIERERMAELAKAKTHEELDAVNDHYDDRVKAEQETTPEPEAPARAIGQTVTTDFEITRINEMQLAKARPDLVRKIEFDMRAIKDCLKRGVKLPGVEAREIVKSSVRQRSVAAIDV